MRTVNTIFKSETWAGHLEEWQFLADGRFRVGLADDNFLFTTAHNCDFPNGIPRKGQLTDIVLNHVGTVKTIIAR